MDDDIDEVASENEPENEPRFVSEGEWVMPYADAVLILQEKFNATTEDMVTWIETKELIPKDAWLETNVGGRQEVILRWSFADLESNELDSLLDTLYFNENKIKQFEPKNKWLTFKQVLERWPPRDCKNKKRIKSRLKNQTKAFERGSKNPLYSSIDIALIIKDREEAIQRFLPEQKPSLEPQAEDVVDDDECNKTTTERQSQLYIFIWRVHQFLSQKKKPTAQHLWNEIQHRHEDHDTEKIIQEVDGYQISWCSSYGNEQKLKRTSFDKTLSNLRKNPPF